MRFATSSVSVGLGIAVLLAAAGASAAGGVGGKGDTGGKGGIGPDTSTKSGAEGTASTPGSEVDITEVQFRNKSTLNPDEATEKRREEKPWEVAATYELHRLIRQEDVAGALKVWQLLGVSAKYSFTAHDTVSAFGGATEGFIADQTETGVRANDISLQYAHVFDLPEKFKLRAAAGATLPISYYSQLASNITTPSISVGLSRKFGDLALSATVRGAYFWDKYSSSASLGDAAAGNTSGVGSGQANTKYVLGGLLSAEYDLPFHRPLSFGLALSATDYWYYNVGQCPLDANVGAATGMPNAGPSSCPGGTVDTTFGTGQPMQQSYGGEIFARYVMPELMGFKSDLTVAFGNSNPNFVLHDGIVHPYLFYRDTAEVYVALGGRY
jgi:hypothetical protein